MVESVTTSPRSRAFSSSSEQTPSPCSSKLYSSGRSGRRSVILSAFSGYAAFARSVPHRSMTAQGPLHRHHWSESEANVRRKVGTVGMKIIPVRLGITAQPRKGRRLSYCSPCCSSFTRRPTTRLFRDQRSAGPIQRDNAMLLFFLTPWVAFSLCMASPLPDALRVARAYPF